MTDRQIARRLVWIIGILFSLLVYALAAVGVVHILEAISEPDDPRDAPDTSRSLAPDHFNPKADLRGRQTIDGSTVH